MTRRDSWRANRRAVAPAPSSAPAPAPISGPAPSSRPGRVRLFGRAGAVALTCVLAVSLSACNAPLAPWAAQVDSSTITQHQLMQSLSAIAGNTGYKCLIGATPTGTQRIYGAGDNTYASSFTAIVLSILVQYRVVHQEVARLGLPEPASLVAVAGQQLAQAYGPQQGSPCTEAGVSVLSSFASSYRSLLLQFQIDQDALAAHLAGTDLAGGLPSYEASHPGVTSLSCLSVILVKTKAQASVLRARVEAGASFATLARLHSLDTQSAKNGGKITPCLSPGQLTAPLGQYLAALPTGKVSQPIPFRGNWLLMLVTQRQPQNFAQVVASLMSQQQATLAKLIPKLIRTADVRVNSQYGSWTTRRGLPEVVAPIGPPARFVPNPSAVVGTTPSSGTGTGGTQAPGLAPAG